MIPHVVVMPKSASLVIDGQQITVRAVPFRHLETFAKAAQNAVGSIQLLGSFTVDQILSVLGSKATDIATMCAVCTQPQLSADQVLDLPVDAVADLVVATLEVNGDFFLHRLPALLLRLAGPVDPPDGS